MNNENNKFCTNCGKGIPNTAQYCPYCNTKQPTLNPTYLKRSDVSSHFCPRCENILPNDISYCPYCDEPQTRVSANATQSQPTPTKTAATNPTSPRPRRKKSHFWRNVIVLLIIILLAIIAFFTYQNSQANQAAQAGQKQPQGIERIFAFFNFQSNKYESGQDAAQGVEKIVKKVPNSKGSEVKWDPNSQTVNVNLPASSPIVKSAESGSPQVWNALVKALQTISKDIDSNSKNQNDYSNIRVVRNDTNQPILQVDKGNVSLNSRDK
ncbi:zinc ribbon domain-containing protein [Fructilactobacillus myrtifloralis]|uniref:Zinc ribbon domain-containing protein n=1 Tax=Fructilactobacillus myrtifloralis TaxID=2940301 RepID=A0ABY5BQ16_9LACO|nr:zinc ribbon domain-containing protein [Fructilactobacillus myrtifloralis]USS85564.1 zinc ribbon domain-containing protein [Fructilactobacillus myrtifloralis]